MSRSFPPSVITANALLEGDVVYLRGTEWVRDLSQAEILNDEADAEIRLLEASARVAEVVGVYLIAVDPAKGAPKASHFREAFRARGPSNYPHGKREHI